MRVKLSDNKVISVNEPVERHQLDYIKALSEYEKEKMSLESMANLQDEIVSELASMTIEQVKEMPLVDKNKIMEAIKSRFVVVGKCEYKMDF